MQTVYGFDQVDRYTHMHILSQTVIQTFLVHEDCKFSNKRKLICYFDVSNRPFNHFANMNHLNLW